jgi:SAM-dependent methyltransferase
MDNSFVKKFYQLHLDKYGKEDIRGMGWHDEEEYSIRFEVMTKIADLSNSSILDVGCGFGGLYKYLISSEIRNFSYLGVDIMQQMIETANKNCPTGKFKVCNILEEDVAKHDYIFCIGALNVSEGNFKKYFRKMLIRMIDLANKGVALNFLSQRFYLVKGPYHFEDPYTVKEFLEQEYSDLRVEVVFDDRLKGEAGLYIYKNSK